jgi:hypothetical protein
MRFSVFLLGCTLLLSACAGGSAIELQGGVEWREYPVDPPNPDMPYRYHVPVYEVELVLDKQGHLKRKGDSLPVEGGGEPADADFLVTIHSDIPVQSMAFRRDVAPPDGVGDKDWQVAYHQYMYRTDEAEVFENDLPAERLDYEGHSFEEWSAKTAFRNTETATHVIRLRVRFTSVRLGWSFDNSKLELTLPSGRTLVVKLFQ